MATDYVKEQAFFDRVAAQTQIKPIERTQLERYRQPKNPQLFGKEFMFSLAAPLAGKRVLEIGCGEGVCSIQLAYCGANVTAWDLSPKSIEVAKQRAALTGIPIDFQVKNVVESDSFGEDCYDVIWCDLVLHHLVDSLDSILQKVKQALKPQGLFIAREPLAYARWLKRFRRQIPVAVEATDDEQPFRQQELALVARHFPRYQSKAFRLLSRVDRVTQKMSLLKGLARLDRLILKLPHTTKLAGNLVIWASK